MYEHNPRRALVFDSDMIINSELSLPSRCLSTAAAWSREDCHRISVLSSFVSNFFARAWINYGKNHWDLVSWIIAAELTFAIPFSTMKLSMERPINFIVWRAPGVSPLRRRIRWRLLHSIKVVIPCINKSTQCCYRFTDVCGSRNWGG